jgi:hypothetical protein
MALSNEELDYLTRPDKIRTSHLSQEAKEFRDKYLKGIYKQNRLERQYAKRKAEMKGEEIKTYQYCDWKSEEEFREWLHSDRIIRNEILDSVLKDDNWLETLAKKYYNDNWMVVYADLDTGRNWKRDNDLPQKKRLKTDEE